MLYLPGLTKLHSLCAQHVAVPVLLCGDLPLHLLQQLQWEVHILPESLSVVYCFEQLH